MKVHAFLSQTEFKQLAGHVENLCLFSSDTISEYASCIKTGARHSYAKYLLLPVVFRRQFQTLEYDFEMLKCGVLELTDCVFVIYKIPKQGLT